MKIVKKSEMNQKVPEESLILAKNTYFSTDSFKTWNNNNILVVGTTGGGKTRCLVEPAIMQAESSFVISDPKGKLYKDYKPYLESKGYTVHKVDFINPLDSVHYNPILFCKNTQDILKLAYTITYFMEKDKRVGGDPFWDEATLILLTALIAFLLETEDIPVEEKNLQKITELISNDKMISNGRTSESALESMMKKHAAWYREKYGKESWAWKRYKEFSLAPDKTHNTICITSCAKFASLDSEELAEMLRYNEIDFNRLGTEKTALFLEVSDSDRSMDTLVNLFYTQLMNILCLFADKECENNRLPHHVRFILDDFATNAKIDNFENMISNIRSRNISAMLMVQAESQLEDSYGKGGETIANNCSTYVYLGGCLPQMAEKVARRVNLAENKVLNMPVDMCYVWRRGLGTVYAPHFDTEWYAKEMGFIRGKACLFEKKEAENVEPELKSKDDLLL